jgi:hypothetical protein
MLTRDQLLSNRLPEIEIDMPEFNGTIRARGLTAGEALEHFETMGEKTRIEAISQLIAVSVIDDNGEKVFQNGDAETIGATWPNSALQRAAFEIMKLNGVDLEKNLSAIEGEDLSSD